VRTAVYHNVAQNSEDWDKLRRGCATTSRFGDIITPSKLQLSKSSVGYAAQLVAERLGVQSPPPPPSYWMEYGTEAEQYAVAEFETTFNLRTQEIGFVEVVYGSELGLLNGWIGGSPDRLIGDDGLLEIKCVKAETLIGYRSQPDTVPSAYTMQTQGQLWVTQRKSVHLYIWHPQVEPLYFAIEPDVKVQAAFDSALPSFVLGCQTLMNSVPTRPLAPELIYLDESEDLS